MQYVGESYTVHSVIITIQINDSTGLFSYVKVQFCYFLVMINLIISQVFSVTLSFSIFIETVTRVVRRQKVLTSDSFLINKLLLNKRICFIILVKNRLNLNYNCTYFIYDICDNNLFLKYIII